jgi:hypothetical protein
MLNKDASAPGEIVMVADSEDLTVATVEEVEVFSATVKALVEVKVGGVLSTTGRLLHEILRLYLGLRYPLTVCKFETLRAWLKIIISAISPVKLSPAPPEPISKFW